MHVVGETCDVQQTYLRPALGHVDLNSNAKVLLHIADLPDDLHETIAGTFEGGSYEGQNHCA
jgi:hypothetical protein